MGFQWKYLFFQARRPGIAPTALYVFILLGIKEKREKNLLFLSVNVIDSNNWKMANDYSL